MLRGCQDESGSEMCLEDARMKVAVKLARRGVHGLGKGNLFLFVSGRICNLIRRLSVEEALIISNR